jgi:hypothetical protein
MCRSLYPFVRMAVGQTLSHCRGMNYVNCVQHFFSNITYCYQGKLHSQRKLPGIVSVDIDATGKVLTIYSAFDKYLR